MNLVGEGVLGERAVVHWTSLLSPLPDVTTLNQSLSFFFLVFTITCVFY